MLFRSSITTFPGTSTQAPPRNQRALCNIEASSPVLLLTAPSAFHRSQNKLRALTRAPEAQQDPGSAPLPLLPAAPPPPLSAPPPRPTPGLVLPLPCLADSPQPRSSQIAPPPLSSLCVLGHLGGYKFPPVHRPIRLASFSALSTG